MKHVRVLINMKHVRVLINMNSLSYNVKELLINKTYYVNVSKI